VRPRVGPGPGITDWPSQPVARWQFRRDHRNVDKTLCTHCGHHEVVFVATRSDTWWEAADGQFAWAGGALLTRVECQWCALTITEETTPVAMAGGRRIMWPS
jgi:hypothetical protein